MINLSLRHELNLQELISIRDQFQLYTCYASSCESIVTYYTVKQPRYNWNIVESGVKHHQTNKTILWRPVLMNQEAMIAIRTNWLLKTWTISRSGNIYPWGTYRGINALNVLLVLWPYVNDPCDHPWLFQSGYECVDICFKSLI